MGRRPQKNVLYVPVVTVVVVVEATPELEPKWRHEKTEQRNFVTISTDKNKLRLNPKFGAAGGKDGIKENFSQILLEVSWKKWPRKYKI